MMEMELLICEVTNRHELAALIIMFEWQRKHPEIRNDWDSSMKHSKGSGGPCLFRDGALVACGFFNIVKWFSEESGLKLL